MKVIKLQNIEKHFNGVYAIDKLSIDIEKGKVLGIIGSNGSGKSTLLSILIGLLFPDKGQIIIDGFRMKSMKLSYAHLFGMIRTFQEIRLFDNMSVLENVLIALTKRNIWGLLLSRNKKTDLKQAEDVLSQVGLLEKKELMASNLSYGQRKLLEIARALATDAEIYLFDEPFSGIFPATKVVITSIIKKLKENKKTIVLVEHDFEVIKAICDYVIVLNKGKISACGNPDQISCLKEK